MNLQTSEVFPDEDIENIIWGGFSLIQKKKGFRFGIDAYLLADFTKLKPREKIIELGTGTGIISLLLTAKRPHVNITALDIQAEMTDLAKRSIGLNNLSNIKIVTEDIRTAPDTLGKGNFTLVVSNPPYFPVKAGEHSPHAGRAISRTEILCSLEDLINSAALLLNYGGRFCFIHRPSRLPEILTTLQKYRLEAKRMRLVFPYANKEPNLVLIEARKDAGQELRILPPLFVYDQPGEYSQEIKRFFEQDQSEGHRGC